MSETSTIGFASKHEPETVALFEFLSNYDFNECDDYFGWKSGGDGDNGEVLMGQLDVYFRTMKIKKEKNDESKQEA